MAEIETLVDVFVISMHSRIIVTVPHIQRPKWWFTPFEQTQQDIEYIVVHRNYDRVLNLDPAAGSDGNDLVGFNQDIPKDWRVYECRKKGYC
jgi:hypothetical protein